MTHEGSGVFRKAFPHTVDELRTVSFSDLSFPELSLWAPDFWQN